MEEGCMAGQVGYERTRGEAQLLFGSMSVYAKKQHKILR